MKNGPDLAGLVTTFWAVHIPIHELRHRHGHPSQPRFRKTFRINLLVDDKVE